MYLLGRLAIIALLIYVGVTLWYGRTGKNLQTMVPVEKEEPAAPQKSKKSKPAPSEKNDYKVILTRNIFKAILEPKGKPTDSEQADLDSLEETSMQLALLGTVSGSREDARAIIREEKSKKEDIYQVGSELQGAILTRIERGKVVLQVNGREEVLNIKDPESGGPQGAASGGEPVVPQGDGESPIANPMPVVQQDETPDRRVPEALPRRRINFRNNTQTEQPDAAQPVTDPAAQSGDQAVPQAEPTPSPTGENDSTQPAQ